MVLVAICLFWLGLCLGSFVNALVWRIHQQSKSKKTNKDLSIINGRSMCPKCHHELKAGDLVPLFSWLLLRGRCRYCKKPIDDNPFVELTAGLIFVASYIFWPQSLSGHGQIILLGTWLVCSVGLLALAVYDFKWMLLPNRILYPTLLVAATGRVIYIAGFEPDKLHNLVGWVLSVAVASGVFFVLFIVSKGRWIGYGDVRLGLLTGTLLAGPQEALLMIFMASILGTLFILPALISGKQKMVSKLPFGPFLILATFLVILFGNSILDWYKNLIF
jgi:prepilin signal peptidase PulO-like enzyme (type II secretory pathway)